MGAFGYFTCIPVACLVQAEVLLFLGSPVSYVSLHSAKIVLNVCNAWQ